jgi:aspartokinase/homoserine dehydrogenase 1
VGAGLPVLSTLRSLLETGDEVTAIEGILSGTLSHIFNTYAPGMAFSDVVRDAKARGPRLPPAARPPPAAARRRVAAAAAV